MGLGFRSEVHYDAGKDVTFLTSDSPDFSSELRVPFARNSDEDKAVRSLLEEQEVVDFAGLSAVTKLPSLDAVGDFGVHGDGSISDKNIANTPHLMVAGKYGSGIENLVRSWLLWAVKEKAYILAVNQPADLHGAAAYFNADKVQHYTTYDSTAQAFTLEETFEALKLDAEEEGVPVLVLTQTVRTFDSLTPADRRFYNKLVETGNDFGEDVYSLTVSDVLLDFEEDTDRLDYWVIGDDVYTGFIGDVTDVTASYLLNDRKDIPSRNPRGVLWIGKTPEDYERINTYMIPRTAWDDVVASQSAPLYLIF